MLTCAVAVVLLATTFAAETSVLRLVASRGTTRVGLWPCLTAVVGCHLAGVVVWRLIQPKLSDDTFGGILAFYIAAWLAALPAVYLLNRRAAWTTVKRWLLFSLVVLAEGLLFGFGVDEYVLETAQAHLAAMNPTLRSFYTVQRCPSCGGEFSVTLYRTVGRDGTERVDERFRKIGACADCFHGQDVPTHDGPFQRPDHFVVDHLRPPERWQVVAFAQGSPHGGGRPKTGRLVGLPGEKLFIRNGSVWVNDERRAPPGPLGLLRYTEDGRTSRSGC